MRRLLQRVALVCLGLVIGALLGEGGLRLLGRGSSAPERRREPGKGLMQPDQQTGWIPRPGAEQEGVDLRDRPFVVRINSSGQRGREVGPRRPQHRRVLFLGDSFTMADQVAPEETFVARVGQLLKRGVGPQVQVINGGVNGYSTYQELAYYRYHGRPLEPDMVVLCFFPGNDFRDTMISTRQGRFLNPVLIPEPERFTERHTEPFLRTQDDRLLGDPLSGAAIPRPTGSWMLWLERRLLLARLLGSRYARLQGRLTADLELLDLHHRYYFYEVGFYQGRDDGFFRTARELTLECLEQLDQLVRDDGAELLVAVLPAQNQVDPRQFRRYLEYLGLEAADLGALDKAYPNRLVTEFCAAREIPCLDLTSAFAPAENPAGLYLTAIGDGHFSAAGHGLAADELAGFLGRESSHLRGSGVTSLRAGLGHAADADWEAAGEEFRSGLRQHPAWAPLHAALAELNRRLERWAEAEAAYGRALDLDSLSAPTWAGLAESRVARGDTAGAVAAFAQARALRPNWWPYDERLAKLCAVQGLSDQAAEAGQRVAAVFAAGPMAKRYWWFEHTFQGTRLAARARWPEAEEEFNRAARLIPDEPVSHHNLAMLYARTGRGDQAAAARLRASEVAPEFPIAVTQGPDTLGEQEPEHR